MIAKTDDPGFIVIYDRTVSSYIAEYRNMASEFYLHDKYYYYRLKCAYYVASG